MAQNDDIDTSKLAVITVTGALLVVAIIGLVEALFYKREQELHVKNNVMQPNRALTEYLTQQQERLHHVAWVDKNTQTVAIPIEDAMHLVVRDFNQPKPAVTEATPAKTNATPVAKPAPTSKPAPVAPAPKQP